MNDNEIKEREALALKIVSLLEGKPIGEAQGVLECAMSYVNRFACVQLPLNEPSNLLRQD
jgi:hypothetical protein